MCATLHVVAQQVGGEGGGPVDPLEEDGTGGKGYNLKGILKCDPWLGEKKGEGTMKKVWTPSHTSLPHLIRAYGKVSFRGGPRVLQESRQKVEELTNDVVLRVGSTGEVWTMA